MRNKPTLPPVDTWALISDGIEGPLRGGFYRGIKHLDVDLTDEDIRRITEAQHGYVMNWFSETFKFDDNEEEE